MKNDERKGSRPRETEGRRGRSSADVETGGDAPEQSRGTKSAGERPSWREERVTARGRKDRVKTPTTCAHRATRRGCDCTRVGTLPIVAETSPSKRKEKDGVETEEEGRSRSLPTSLPKLLPIQRENS